jgi:hypothetical protein
VGVDEKTLRATRTELLEGVADLHRGQGQIPNTRAMERFIDPILNKVDQSSDEKRPAPPVPKPKNRIAKSGDWYGEAEHSPRVGKGRIADALPGETVKLTSQYVGDYAVKGQKVIPLNGAPDGKRREVDEAAFTRWLFGSLMHHPDFKARITAVTFSDLAQCAGTTRCSPWAGGCCARSKALRKIADDAFRLFGDAKAVWQGAPSQPAKIIVGGK